MKTVCKPQVSIPNIAATLFAQILIGIGSVLALNTSDPVVYTVPAFPTVNDTVTIFFDASEGNGALADFAGPIYAHTGVITNRSTNGSDWKHVIGNWGTADARTRMTKVDSNRYALSYQISDFYGITPGEEVLQMAFVFRNTAGSIVGRDANGSDIFVEVFPPDQGLFLTVRSPTTDHRVVLSGDSILIDLVLNDSAALTVSDNDSTIYQGQTDQAQFYFTPADLGPHHMQFRAMSPDTTITINRKYLVLASEQVLTEPPADTRNGINYFTDSTYLFRLFAPEKKFVFLLTAHGDYQIDQELLMNKSADGIFWLEVPHLFFSENRHTYQYLVDGLITVADPYAQVVLDPNNDQEVRQNVLDRLPAYPEGAEGIVTVFDSLPSTYAWIMSDFQKPQKRQLVIYELLLRDFLADHSFQSLTDTLDYLAKLGINAIELMPINEFEGNDSWGYNPSFHSAVDKYYGHPDELRAFIDAAHARGIAVILDVVFNHAFSQSPLAQLYWDQANFRPAPDNPWLNVTPRHPFNVGYDFNHESAATKEWVKSILSTWINEFRFDGFRFDLSKGLTQFNSGSNAGLMAQYDAGRIAILKDYADHIWSLDSTSYVIMEHFAENREEQELSDYGMMLWGNVNHVFGEAAKGFRTNLDGADYTARGWNDPHLIAYMESHDEQRIGYRVQNEGDREDGYNTRELKTALERMAAISTIYYTIPGPKMLWQFGELGYDFSINRCTDGSINSGCRLSRRPIRWDYLEDADRRQLFNITSSLIKLRNTYPTFTTDDFTFNDANLFIKSVELRHPDFDAFSLVNFRVTTSSVIPKFPYSGIWYEYFSGDSIVVDDLNARMDLKPGAYRIYTSMRLDPPDLQTTASRDFRVASELQLYPNPVAPEQSFHIDNSGISGKSILRITDAVGRIVHEEKISSDRSGLVVKSPSSPGTYFIHLQNPRGDWKGKILVQ